MPDPTFLDTAKTVGPLVANAATALVAAAAAFWFFLKSGSFCSCGQPENSHTAGILPIGDEFRERIIFRGIEEIIGERPP
jgi:hypothetical protein